MAGSFDLLVGGLEIVLKEDQSILLLDNKANELHENLASNFQYNAKEVQKLANHIKKEKRKILEDYTKNCNVGIYLTSLLERKLKEDTKRVKLDLRGLPPIHFIGYGHSIGTIEILGNVGDYAGAFMKNDALLHIKGCVGKNKGYRMIGGAILVENKEKVLTTPIFKGFLRGYELKTVKVIS